MSQTYDLIIIGGGPAAMTASVYALRRQIKTLVIAKNLGGQAALASEVQNWPGIESISGFELMQNFIGQAKKLGLETVSNEVIEIKQNKDNFSVVTNTQKYSSKSVILAFGLTPRDLGVPGEQELKGRGVTYCATCDGPLFRNKAVAVAGGGNSALEAAEYLAKLAKQVYLINNTDSFIGESVLAKKIKSNSNIIFYCSHQIKELIGEKKLEKAVLIDLKTKKLEELILDGLFVEVGHQAKTAWLKGLVDLNVQGEIITQKDTSTSQPGIFAAGDCTDAHFKQIVIASGEGAKAALSAYQYLANKSGKAMRPDWGKC